MFLPASSAANQCLVLLQHSLCELLDSDKIVDGERVQFLGELGKVAVLSK